MPSYMSNRSPWFAFLVHPRNMDDLYREGATRFLREYSDTEEEFRDKVCSLKPLVIGDLIIGTSVIKGEVISVMRLPENMIQARAGQDVLEGTQVAVQRGTRVIGLGALTAPATGGGMTLLKHLPPGVTVTNGNAYTAAVVRHNVVEASEAMGLGARARVAVVGCTGSVGVPASRLLAAAGFGLALIGRSEGRVRQMLGDLAATAAFASDLRALRDADIIVLLTSDRTAQIAPEMVRSGAVIIDCAQPANIPLSGYAAFSRNKVAVVEGAVVRIPGFSATTDLGLSARNEAYACLAETYLFARAGIREHSVGAPSVDRAEQMERLAGRYSIAPRPLGSEVPAACT